MASPTYTTKATFKTMFGIDSSFTADDSYIDNLLAAEESNIENDLGYTLGEESAREDEWVASVERRIDVPKPPVHSVSDLEVNDLDIGSDYYDISEDGFFIWLDDTYDYCGDIVEVYLKCTCGYGTSADTIEIPRSLRNVIYFRVAEIYAKTHVTFQKREGVEDGVFTTPTQIQTILNNYKVWHAYSQGKIS